MAGRIEGQWCALDECFAENVIVEHAFREGRSLKAGPAYIIMRATLAGMTPPEFQTTVENIVHMKGEGVERGAWVSLRYGS